MQYVAQQSCFSTGSWQQARIKTPSWILQVTWPHDLYYSLKTIILGIFEEIQVCFVKSGIWEGEILNLELNAANNRSWKTQYFVKMARILISSARESIATSRSRGTPKTIKGRWKREIGALTQRAPGVKTPLWSLEDHWRPHLQLGVWWWFDVPHSFLGFCPLGVCQAEI